MLLLLRPFCALLLLPRRRPRKAANSGGSSDQKSAPVAASSSASFYRPAARQIVSYGSSYRHKWTGDTVGRAPATLLQRRADDYVLPYIQRLSLSPGRAKDSSVQGTARCLRRAVSRRRPVVSKAGTSLESRAGRELLWTTLPRGRADEVQRGRSGVGGGRTESTGCLPAAG